MNEDLTRQLLRRIAALERRLGIQETIETGAGHSHAYSDHGNLTGLADDDHTQYLLAAGTRTLTADWDIGDGRKIIADAIRARDAAGLSLQDDGGNVALKINDGGALVLGVSIDRVRSAEFSLDDDTATNFTPPKAQGIIVIFARQTGARTFCGMATYQASVAPLVLAGGGGLVGYYGAMGGTTGTDGKLSVAFAGGKIYIENRSGGTFNGGYLLIC